MNRHGRRSDERRLELEARGEEPTGSTLRAFVAVEVGQEVQRRAAEIVERLRGADDVKWVRPENFHLTIQFLGETRRADLPPLSAALRGLAERAAPFDLELAGVGAFPNVRRPRVVWLGVSAGREALTALAEAAEDVCAALGWPREARPYQAHLTLGRSRNDRPRSHPSERREGRESPPAARRAPSVDLARKLETERESHAGGTRVGRLVLMQSQLRPDGPIYTVIDTFPLGGSKAVEG